MLIARNCHPLTYFNTHQGRDKDAYLKIYFTGIFVLIRRFCFSSLNWAKYSTSINKERLLKLHDLSLRRALQNEISLSDKKSVIFCQKGGQSHHQVHHHQEESEIRIYGGQAPPPMTYPWFAAFAQRSGNLR